MMEDKNLEDALRIALRREPAPVGFAQRVLARAVGEQHPGFFFALFHSPAFRFAATAVLVIAVVGGIFTYRRHERERVAGEEARQQLMLALRISGSKLQYAQHKVQEVSAQQYGPGTTEGDDLQ